MSLAEEVAERGRERVTLWKDQRWALAQRIAHSSEFARSEQLSRFLLYVCRMALTGHEEEISEQRIGTDVFGRQPSYDPSVDGIVRSHATRLRRRLEVYFQKDGAQESLLIDIPRGGYVPHFVERQARAVAPAESEFTDEIAVPGAGHLSSATATVPSKAPSRKKVWGAFAMGVAAAVFIGVIFLHLRNDRETATSRWTPAQTDVERKFWNTLFPAKGKTMIVSGDSGLVLYETEVNRQITLDEYVSGAYRDPAQIKPAKPGISREAIMDLASRRYTSTVDLRLVSQLTHLPQWTPDHAETIFARDVVPAEARTANLILIGSKQANPWISLIEPSLNFVLTPEGDGKFEFVNRHPRPGEQDIYTPETVEDNLGTHVVYGTVAYVPNPGGQGMILNLGGLWMSGTQSAGDFVLNSHEFSDFLRSIMRPDGTFPPFELLIRAKSLGGNATDATLLSKRVSGQASN